MRRYTLSPLNYIGGKGRILDQIMPLLPRRTTTFVDLFCGGCNVGINASADRVIYNDCRPELIGLLRMFSRRRAEDLIADIRETAARYGLTDTATRGYACYHCNSSQGVAAYNRDRYLQMRADFNRLTIRDDRYYTTLYTLILFGFNNQLRFNAAGDFNLPVGKRDFNAALQLKLRRFVYALQRQNAVFTCQDFQAFDTTALDSRSFVYADPPYLITTATYNEQHGWDTQREKALLGFLDSLDRKGIRFALSNVITHKGRTNSLLKTWADSRHYAITPVAMDYANSNYQVKETTTDTREVLITNYSPRRDYATDLNTLLFPHTV